MLDWVTAKIPFEHDEPINAGNVISIDRNGIEEWKTDKRLSIVGSHDAQLHIKSDNRTRDPVTGRYTHIMLDGNPAKFLQGHNLWGSDDLIGLVSETIYRVFTILGLYPTAADWIAITLGCYDVFRIDSTTMIDCGSNADVNAFIYSASLTAHMRYKGQGQMAGKTLYFGKKSKRESMKMYNKLEETMAKGHRLPLELEALPELKNWVSGKLRVEVVTRRMQLIDLELDRANRWDDDAPTKNINRLLGGLNMSEQHTLTGANLDGLSPRLIAVYHMWKEGHDLKKIYLDKKTGYPNSTFKRYRKELRIHGIDIAVKQGNRSEPAPNVIDFRRVLTPTRCEQVPAWAIGTLLYFEPRAKMPAYELLYPQAMTG